MVRRGRLHPLGTLESRIRRCEVYFDVLRSGVNDSIHFDPDD